MNLKEEFNKVPSLGMEFGNPTATKRDPEETEELVAIAKIWALEMVGESYPISEDVSFPGLCELIGRNWEKQKIRQRIEESTK